MSEATTRRMQKGEKPGAAGGAPSRPERALIWAGRLPAFAFAVALFVGTLCVKGARILLGSAIAGVVYRCR